MLEVVRLKDNEEAVILPAECLQDEYGVIVKMSKVRSWYPHFWMEEALEYAQGRSMLSDGALYPIWEDLSDEAQADVLLTIYDVDLFRAGWSFKGRIVLPGSDAYGGSLFEVACRAYAYGVVMRGGSRELQDPTGDAKITIEQLCADIDVASKDDEGHPMTLPTLAELLSDLVDCEYFTANTVYSVVNSGWPCLPPQRVANIAPRRFFAPVSSYDVLASMKARELDVPRDPAELREIMDGVQRYFFIGASGEAVNNDMQAALTAHFKRGE